MIIGAVIGWFIGLVLCLWQIFRVVSWVDRYNNDPLNMLMGNRRKVKLNWPVRCAFVLTCIMGGAIIGHFVS